jgi:hypothetical protein
MTNEQEPQTQEINDEAELMEPDWQVLRKQLELAIDYIYETDDYGASELHWQTCYILCCMENVASKRGSRLSPIAFTW